MRLLVVFHGRVQGVGFRATARDVASRHAVTGWVRNQADGAVALEVQGDSVQVEAFLEGLAQVMGSRIRGSNRTSVPSVEGEAEFEIRR